MQLPADRLFAGRTDLLLLAVDPAGLDPFEPGMPYDPPDMRFPHAYGPSRPRRSSPCCPYQAGRDGGPPPQREEAGRRTCPIGGFAPAPATVFGHKARRP